MRWKTLLLTACLAPSFTGCNIAYYSAKNILNEPYTLTDQLFRSHDLRSEAKAAWREVRMQYPRCLFTAEFRDGFIDGYSDYLDRGGNAQPPAVPPKKYTRNKYLNPEGHALIQDYFLGFDYGVNVALATDQRKYKTVPVLLPNKELGAPRFNVQRPEPSGETLPTPKPLETSLPPLPPILPPGLRPDGPGAGPVTATPVSRPIGTTIIPLRKGTRAGREASVNTVDVPTSDRLPPTSVPVGETRADGAMSFPPLPSPPGQVRVLPKHVPTPSILDDLPQLPANLWIPEPKPVNFDPPKPTPPPAAVPLPVPVPPGTIKPAPAARP